MLSATEMKEVLKLNRLLVKGIYMSAFSEGGGLAVCIGVPEGLRGNQEFF